MRRQTRFSKTERRSLRTETLESRQLLAADVLISEFSASNDAVLRDGDRDYPDWIELHNAGDEAQDLTGWHLSDNDSLLTKWTFPSWTLNAGEFLVVFASGKDGIDNSDNLHTNFRLTREFMS